MSQLDVLEVALRGGASGLALLLALALSRLAKASPSALAGALFALGSSGYALVSSPILWEAVGPLREVLRLAATYNSLFFWWFATALFDDSFRCRPWRWAPAGAITLVVLARALSPAPWLDAALAAALQLLVLGLLAHALILAVQGWGPDLVEPRRRFRVGLVVLSALLGFAIAAAELALLRGPIPEVLTRLHALALFALTFGFGLWALDARQALFPPRMSGPAAAREPASASPEDRRLLERLKEVMDAGVYAEPGLSVGVLAARLGAPEHRLRRAINQHLGYRNFTAFLNERRIADAKAVLADPNQARRQVLQVALDLGYGSIGPFNRAFRDATGMAPRAYRRLTTDRAAPRSQAKSSADSETGETSPRR